MRLIGIGSFVLGLFQGPSFTHTDEATHRHTLSRDPNDLEGFVRGRGVGSVRLVNDSHRVKADRVDR